MSYTPGSLIHQSHYRMYSLILTSLPSPEVKLIDKKSSPFNKTINIHLHVLRRLKQEWGRTLLTAARNVGWIAHISEVATSSYLPPSMLSISYWMYVVTSVPKLGLIQSAYQNLTYHTLADSMYIILNRYTGKRHSQNHGLMHTVHDTAYVVSFLFLFQAIFPTVVCSCVNKHWCITGGTCRYPSSTMVRGARPSFPEMPNLPDTVRPLI